MVEDVWVSGGLKEALAILTCGGAAGGGLLWLLVAIE